METDACDDGVGAVLMQHGQPIAFLVKALGDKHRHLSIYEKEFLALIMAVEKWRQYLQQQEFIIKTGHKSLAYLSEQNLHSDMQRKAMARLMGLQFKIVYHQGKDNAAADALSQVASLLALQAVSQVQPVWIQEVLNSYATDVAHAQLLLTQLALHSPDSNGYSLEHGLIRHKGVYGLGRTLPSKLNSLLLFIRVLLGAILGQMPHIIVLNASLSGKAFGKMWTTMLCSAKSVSRLNIHSSGQQVFFSRCQFLKECGRISLWILWKGYPNQRDIMPSWWLWIA